MAKIEREPEFSRTALVLFGTETGTAQDLAHESSRILERLHFVTDVQEFNSIPAQSLAQYTLVVFVLSTTGQGDFPSNSLKFWKTLLLKRLASTFLSGVEYALVGLGDSSYPKFNFAARKLHKRLGQLGATSLLQPCEADEQGEDSTDGAFIAWSQLFRTKILEAYPLSEGLEPIPENQPLRSKWTLEEISHNGVNYDGFKTNGHSDPLSTPSVKTLDVSFQVTLEVNDRVTPTDHWQDVRFLKLKSIQNYQYFPGDAIAIRPKNTEEDAQEMIDLMQWGDIADKQLRFRLNQPNQLSQRLPDPALSIDQHITLRQLLINNLDLKAIPRRSFFTAIANYTNDEMHRERSQEFTEAQYLDEYYDYATRPRRSILEILQEFDSVKIPWQEAINVLPILRPRQFSIASGGALKNNGSTFELLVAIVKYRTVIKRIREGVCTRYLANLPVGSTLDVVLKTEGRLHEPEQLQAMRHLLVGAGTGIAPLRAIIHEKINSNLGSTLIFGCRNSTSDYFFEDEWKKLNMNEPNSNLHVITAFSRDQKEKVYVQNRIQQNASLVLKLLYDKDAAVVICGSSGAMPKAIRQAFVDVLCSESNSHIQQKMSTEEAEQFLAKMEKDGRYKQETW